MATYTEGKYSGDWLKWEQDARFSREKVTVVSGQTLVSGAVVGKITASGKYAAYDNTGNTGIETAAGILLIDVDASAADKSGVIIARDAVINPNLLTWHSNNDAAAKTAGLADMAALNILARTGV